MTKNHIPVGWIQHVGQLGSLLLMTSPFHRSNGQRPLLHEGTDAQRARKHWQISAEPSQSTSIPLKNTHLSRLPPYGDCDSRDQPLKRGFLDWWNRTLIEKLGHFYHPFEWVSCMFGMVIHSISWESLWRVVHLYIHIYIYIYANKYNIRYKEINKWNTCS